MMRRLLMAALVAVPLGGIAGPGNAVNPDEVLSNPVLETRAREISKELRCLVCQNQSIDDSDADLAKDLRRVVRERLVDGDTDQEVIEFVVARYGDFVLLRPPVKGATLFLWGGPALFVLLGVLATIYFFRRAQGHGRKAVRARPLSAEEKAKLDRLLDDSPPEPDTPARAKEDAS